MEIGPLEKHTTHRTFTERCGVMRLQHQAATKEGEVFYVDLESFHRIDHTIYKVIVGDL